MKTVLPPKQPRRGERLISILSTVLLLAGIGLFAGFHLQNLSAGEEKPRGKEKGKDAAKENLIGTVEQLIPTGLSVKHETLKDGKRTLKYLSIKGADGKVSGYIFTNEELDTKLKGYNGPIILGVRTDPAGVSQDLVILKHTETPRFLARVLAQKAMFLGKTIIPAAKPKVDVVTGATYSSTAINDGLLEIGTAFKSVLQPAAKTEGAQKQEQPAAAATGGNSPASGAGPGSASGNGSSASGGSPGGSGWLGMVESPGWRSWGNAAAGGGLLLAFGLVILLRWKPRRLYRGAFLLVTAIGFGVLAALQFSLDSVLNIFSMSVPGFSLTPGFVLGVGVPVLVLLLGNYYCGWLCPFGALQEWAATLNPFRKHRVPVAGAEAGPERAGRVLRYLVLLLVLALFATGAGFTLAEGDFLVMLWQPEMLPLSLALLAGLLLAMSFFAPRFWCRTLCPSGAFLSLLGRVRLVWRLLGKKWWLRHFPVTPRYCDLGVQSPFDGECLCCDRCRITRDSAIHEKQVHPEAAAAAQPTEPMRRRTMLYALCAAGFFVWTLLEYLLHS